VKTTVEKLSPTRVKLNISVSPEELQPSSKHAYEHIASQVNVPGFRKGKVPPQLIDQRVGREEVLNHAVSALPSARKRRQNMIQNEWRPIYQTKYLVLIALRKVPDSDGLPLSG